ncbi:hypothetical protein RRG08_011687, partial [Elysia crispata]
MSPTQARCVGDSRYTHENQRDQVYNPLE